MNSFVWNLLIIWILIIPYTFSVPYFVENPPVGFYNRKSIDDCQEIFYSSWKQPPGTDAPAFKGVQIFSFSGQNSFMASIGWTSNGITEYRCGGTLISPNFILTAAYCATNENATLPDTVRLGDTHLESTIGDTFAQQIKVRTIKRHPNYMVGKSYFDIALIELETNATVTFDVCPACLWLEKDLPKGPMQSIGFGASNVMKRSLTLQEVTLSAIDDKVCSDQLPLHFRQFSNGIVDHQFCAGGSPMDTFKADPGSPIHVLRADIDGSVFPLVVGIASISSGSARVFTRVADFREWIESATQTSMDYRTCTKKWPNYNSISTHITRKHVAPSLPFHRVGLLWNSSDNNSYQCGATVIDYQYAITSAFCALKYPNFPKFINIQDGAEIVEIEKVIIHPDYSSQHPENGFVLLKLSKYLKGDQHLLPACLKRKIYNPEDNLHFSAYTEKPSDDLYNSGLTIDIQGSMENDCGIPEIFKSFILCANNSVSLIPKACSMDHGGPVTTTVQLRSNSLRVDYLLGVVSELSRDCGGYLFGTRLSSAHIEWIENVVLENTNDRLVFF